MATPTSYTITRYNNKTEKEGLAYLLAENTNFILPSKKDREKLMEIFSIEKKYTRAFDLIYIKNAPKNGKITVKNKEKIIFVELKTTKKYLPNNPRNFFFGATKNEFDLATKLGDAYQFCFVCLHKDSRSYTLLTKTELEKNIRNKRVQYQINLY